MGRSRPGPRFLCEEGGGRVESSAVPLAGHAPSQTHTLPLSPTLENAGHAVFADGAFEQLDRHVPLGRHVPEEPRVGERAPAQQADGAVCVLGVGWGWVCRTARVARVAALPPRPLYLKAGGRAGRQVAAAGVAIGRGRRAGAGGAAAHGAAPTATVRRPAGAHTEAPAAGGPAPVDRATMDRPNADLAALQASRAGAVARRRRPAGPDSDAALPPLPHSHTASATRMATWTSLRRR